MADQVPKRELSSKHLANLPTRAQPKLQNKENLKRPALTTQRTSTSKADLKPNASSPQPKRPTLAGPSKTTSAASLAATSTATSSRYSPAASIRSSRIGAKRIDDASANQGSVALGTRASGASIKRTTEASKRRPSDTFMKRPSDSSMASNAIKKRASSASMKKSSTALAKRTSDASIHQTPTASTKRVSNATSNQSSIASSHRANTTSSVRVALENKTNESRGSEKIVELESRLRKAIEEKKDFTNKWEKREGEHKIEIGNLEERVFNAEAKAGLEIRKLRDDLDTWEKKERDNEKQFGEMANKLIEAKHWIDDRTARLLQLDIRLRELNDENRDLRRQIESLEAIIGDEQSLKDKCHDASDLIKILKAEIVVLQKENACMAKVDKSYRELQLRYGSTVQKISILKATNETLEHEKNMLISRTEKAERQLYIIDRQAEMKKSRAVDAKAGDSEPMYIEDDTTMPLTVSVPISEARPSSEESSGKPAQYIGLYPKDMPESSPPHISDPVNVTVNISACNKKNWSMIHHLAAAVGKKSIVDIQGPQPLVEELQAKMKEVGDDYAFKSSKATQLQTMLWNQIYENRRLQRAHCAVVGHKNLHDMVKAKNSQLEMQDMLLLSVGKELSEARNSLAKYRERNDR